MRLEQLNSQVANASIAGLLVRNGVPPSWCVAAGALLLAAIAAWAWRRKPEVTTTSGVALVGTLLGSPLAWVGYSVFLLPIVARTRAGLLLVVACALLCIPRLELQDWATVLPLVGTAYTVGWLLLLMLAIRD